MFDLKDPNLSLMMRVLSLLAVPGVVMVEARLVWAV